MVREEERVATPLRAHLDAAPGAPPAPLTPPAPTAETDRRRATEPGRGRAARCPRLLVDGGLVAMVVGLGFALFRPDWFDNQNGLDPYFYTGLAQNLSDSLDYGTQFHYFLSRWTLYLPGLLAQRLLGPSVGFVLTRLLLLALCGLAVAGLRPAAARRLDVIPVALLALFSPLVVRSVFVDYSDAIVVPCGLAMVALAAKAPIGARTSLAIGGLGACALVANAFAVTMVTIIVGGYLARSLPRPGRVLVQLSTVTAAAAAVVVCGLVLFRWRYGIPNVYGPTVDFVLDNVDRHDPLKSPRLVWLQYRLWVYLPPLVLAAAVALRAARLIRLGAAELVVLGICAAQYAFQVAYQFILNGLTLEVGYYFTYVVPAYTAALVVVLYATLQRCSATTAGATAAAVALTLTLWRQLPEVRLESWVTYAAAVVAVAFGMAVLAHRAPIVVPLGLAAVVLAPQLAPPADEPILPGELQVVAGYATVYRPGPSEGVRQFRASSRFIGRMHGLDLAARKGAGWVVGGGSSARWAALYSVQVGRPPRLLNPPADPAEAVQGVPVTRFAVDRFVDSGFTHVVLVAGAETAPVLLDQLADEGLVLGPPLLDYVDETLQPSMRIVVAAATANEPRAAADPA